MTSLNISLTDLENKKQRIENELKKLHEELGHIDWLLSTFGLNIPEKIDTNLSNMKVEDLIIRALHESGKETLTTGEISRALQQMGKTMKRGTLHAHLSRFTKNLGSQIQRKSLGQYTLKAKSQNTYTN